MRRCSSLHRSCWCWGSACSAPSSPWPGSISSAFRSKRAPWRSPAMSQASSSPSPDLLTWGREVLAKQPFSVLLGAQLDVFEEGRAQLSVPMAGKLLQQNGFVHGGVLAYLADNALTYAGGSALGHAVLTSEFK